MIKKNFNAFILQFIFILLSHHPAVLPKFSISGEEEIRAALKTIFRLCENSGYPEASLKILYTGNDEKRRFKDHSDYQEPKEKDYVDRLCRKVKAYLELSDGYKFGEMRIETAEEGDWYIQEVIFGSGNQHLTISFAFKKINGDFLLGDIY